MYFITKRPKTEKLFESVVFLRIDKDKWRCAGKRHGVVFSIETVGDWCVTMVLDTGYFSELQQ